MEKINIMIIDDEKIKINAIKSTIKRCANKLFPNVALTFSEEDLNNKTKDAIVNYIYDNEVDAVVIDYSFSAAKVDYNGTDLSKYIDEKVPLFPTFMLTAHSDDVYQKESCDTYNVFDFERVSSSKDEKETQEFVSKLIYQIINTRKRFKEMEEYILNNQSNDSNTVSIDSKLLEYDSYLERRNGMGQGLNTQSKKNIVSRLDSINVLIEKVDKIIGENNGITKKDSL